MRDAPVGVRSVMQSVRHLRAGTVAAVVAWKLAALALLPAALCCRAMMVADAGAVPACCQGGTHGAMCPMKRAAAAETGGDRTGPRIVACDSLDDALVGLLSLTGFTPDAFDLANDPRPLDRVAETHHSVLSFDGAPTPPPPRPRAL